MIHAVLVKGKKGFYEGALEGSPLYTKNVTRERDFIVPVVLEDDETIESVISELNSGKRKLLKTKVNVDVGGVETIHSKLSKR